VAAELPEIDVANSPELLKLAERVHADGASLVLSSHGRPLAMVLPAGETGRGRKAERRPTKRRTRNASLRGIIGMIPADREGPTDVAEHHDRYLADAYLDTHG